jgi:hypothetical protein
MVHFFARNLVPHLTREGCPRTPAEGHNISGSAQGPLTIASALVDLTALAEVNRPGISGGSGVEEDALSYGKTSQGTMSGALPPDRATAWRPAAPRTRALLCPWVRATSWCQLVPSRKAGNVP